MVDIETLGIPEEIETLVSDKLQVVSYKWLSRNFMVMSDTAKRLLQEFIQKHENGLEVLYSLSGWLKNSPSSYHIRLVCGSKLEKAKQEFDENCSVQVYSVQASIPKDPAALWNAEFIQAEELFKQPFTVDNCLRDNRFCGVSNSFVRRNVDEKHVNLAAPQTKTAGSSGPVQSNSAHQKVCSQSPHLIKDPKSTVTGNTEVQDHSSKSPADKEKVHSLLASKDKAKSDKNPSTTGGSLANFWSRANAKSKPISAPAENSNFILNTTAASESQNCAPEAVDAVGSDDDYRDVNFKRMSNGEGSKKRKIVLDLSDEDEFEDAINLASPDNFRRHPSQDNKKTDLDLSEKSTLNFDQQVVNKSKEKNEVAKSKEFDQPLKSHSSAMNKSTRTVKSSAEKVHNSNHGIYVKNENQANVAPASPKRKKVLKTRIDERGREVTEVVWEGEEPEAKKPNDAAVKTNDNNSSANRPHVDKKSPAVANSTTNTSGKAGSKKSGNVKDPKQGNLFSFFKRVG